VVVSTHSIFMVDKERIDRHAIVKKVAEVTSLEDITSSNITEEEVIYNALGYSMFESLKPKNVIFEGWRDKRLFLVFCASQKGKSKELHSMPSLYGLCHAKGVKDVPRVATMLEVHGRDAIIVSDSDQPAHQAQTRFVADGTDMPWIRYDEAEKSARTLTAEDFITEKYLLDAFEAQLGDKNLAC